MRLLFVFGTRPEAIKLAPVIRELSARPEFVCKICVTGQHRELLGRFLELFELPPDWNLDVMRPDQGLAYLTGAVLSGVGGVIEGWRPERVIVQGDTTSSFAGALAAFYHQIPVAHVEAGLRTGDLYAPWPEEANRLLVARLADLHFAPTARARDNLLREGVAEARIAVTGNTGIDALLWVSERLETRPDLGARAASVLGPDGAESLAGRRLILMTGHRRESFDGGLERIARAMARIARRPDVAIVFPVHPNPNVRRAIETLRRHDNIRLIEPVDYPELVYLLKRCHCVVADSGGIQEEAPSFGKPVLVTRATTERPEAMEQGLARLVGTDEELLVEALGELLDDPVAYRRMSRVANPYGDGQASRRIADRLAAPDLGAHRPRRRSPGRASPGRRWLGPAGRAVSRVSGRAATAASARISRSPLAERGERGPDRRPGSERQQDQHDQRGERADPRIGFVRDVLGTGRARPLAGLSGGGEIFGSCIAAVHQSPPVAIEPARRPMRSASSCAAELGRLADGAAVQGPPIVKNSSVQILHVAGTSPVIVDISQTIVKSLAFYVARSPAWPYLLPELVTDQR